jgi:molybdenum cofactor cytidylyltransferase
MDMLTLNQALRLSGAPSVALVGAGGKTTALFRLAQECVPALVTTTTHLGEWQVSTADRHVVWAVGESLPSFELAGSTLVTGPLDAATARYRGLGDDQIGRLRKQANHLGRPLFVEADGSRQRPLKAPAEHEPAIPADVDLVLVVAGVQGLGQPLTEEHVHRPSVFARLSGLEIGGTVTSAALSRVLLHSQGGLKGIPQGAGKVVLLNQADTTSLVEASKPIAASLIHRYDAVVVASLQQTEMHAVHERTAGIVLAAGGSARYGQPKQLSDYRGKPFVRAVAETALAAGLSPIFVVTGAQAERVESVVSDLSVTCVHNAAWVEGQSTSIQAGLARLQLPSGAVVFLLADQPHVRPDVINALVERHSQGLSSIVAPRVAGRRANPVLFDRRTFKDLLSLKGDVGGRGIFSRYEVEYVEWRDPSLLLDVDKPEDYQRLMES